MDKGLMISLDLTFHLTLLTALGMAAGFLEKRCTGHPRLGVLLQGALFGGAAVLSMLRPLDLGPGLIFDSRWLTDSLCALFFGPWAAAAAVVLTIVCRMGLGWAGTIADSLAILTSAGIGLLAHFRLKPEAAPPSARGLYLLGLAVHMAALALWLTLSGGTGLTVLLRIALPMLLLYPLATVLAGKVLSDQLKSARVMASVNGSGVPHLPSMAGDSPDRPPDEAALRASKAFLNTLLDAIPVPVFYKDKEGRYLGCNRTFETFFGSTREQLIGKTVFEIHPPELAEIYHAKDTELFESGGVQQYEARVKNALGAERYVILNKAVFTDAHGTLDGVIGTILDITERKEAEQRLLESEKRLSLTLEATRIGIWDWDVKNDRWYASPIYYTMLGYDPKLGLGDRAEWMERVHPDDRAHVAEKIRDVLMQHFTEYRYEARMRHADGSYRWQQVMGFGIERDRDGKVTRILGTRMDITERKKAEQERLEHLRFFECLDQVNRAIQGASDLDQMMGNVLKAMMSIFDCDRAWLLYPCDPDAPTFRVPMEVTRPEYPGAKVLNVDLPMSPEMARNIREALESDGPVAYIAGTERPVNKITAERFGVQSQMVVALHPKLGGPWVFGMHQCSYPRTWTREEQRLFQETGRRMTDALTSLSILRDLKASEEKYRALIQKIQAAVVVHKPDTQILTCNPAAEDLLGLSEDQMLGRASPDPIWHFFREDGTVMPVEEYPVDQVLAKRQALRGFIVGVHRPENQENPDVWVLVNADPVFGKDDQITQVIVTFIDVTERKRMERALEESEAKTRSILDNIGIGVALISPEMKIIELNHRMREWFPDIDPGQRPVCYRAFNDPPRGTMCDYCPTCKTLQDGLVHEATTQTPQAGGVRNYRIVSSPILNASGEITAAIEMVDDITETLSLESQLQQAQKLESVGRLAGGVAHDFNNMLGVILGHTELALDEMDPARPLFAALHEIRKAAERSADLTRQLLAFARKQTVAPRVLDLNETVEGMLRMLRRLIGEDIDLVWLPGKDLWPVHVDPSQIDQILANLCVNARDAIEGVGKVTIESENATFDEAYCADHPGFIPGDFVKLAVSDDGHGMDKETQDQIFEPFFTTKEIGRGTGLGLATVYGSVKQNNGFINVYSEPGHGTIFKVYLPRHGARSEQVRKEGPAAPVVRGYETILLVEDELAILNMARQMLERSGYRVLYASTPGEAIRVAREHPGEIHLLISDVVMPEMNGRDLAKNVIALHPGIKRLFMSGYTANVIAHHGVLDEGINFIQKPFSIQALSAKVREALDSK